MRCRSCWWLVETWRVDKNRYQRRRGKKLVLLTLLSHSFSHSQSIHISYHSNCLISLMILACLTATEL